MGMYGIEFHPGYHQNVAIFQVVWLFKKNRLKLAPPCQITILKYNRKSISFKLQGVQVSPSNEHNSLWEWVVQVGSVDKSLKKNIKTGEVSKILKKNNLLTNRYFS